VLVRDPVRNHSNGAGRHGLVLLVGTAEVILILTAAAQTCGMEHAELPQMQPYRSRLGHNVTGIALIALMIRALFPDPWSDTDLSLLLFLSGVVVVGWLIHWEFAVPRDRTALTRRRRKGIMAGS
jgi:hypothetical protein